MDVVTLALAKKYALKVSASNFDGMTLKTTNADGSQVWTIKWINNAQTYTYDITFPKGVNGYKGVYSSKVLLESTFPTGLAHDEYAIVEDSTTEQVFLANYDTIWKYRRLNNKVVFRKVGEYLKYKFDDEDDTALRIVCPISDLKGDKGDQGVQGIQGLEGKSAYDIAVTEESFSGTKIEWLEKLNSCLGKFSSLADLKIAYPSGIDSYKFAIISTITGQVGIAFYDKSVSNWQVTVFASTNGSSVVTDDKSVGKNSLGNLQLNGFENANNSTVPIKNSSGEISYLEIQKDNTNSFTSIASKEYVDESMVGGLNIQNDYYNASTNTPNLTTINTNGKSYAWIVLVGGTQTLGGSTITFEAFDLVIKTSGGAYLKIHNAGASWGNIAGDITQQIDLINKLNEYAKIDDTDTTSATKTYSIKHILELEDKKRKIFMQSDSPVGMIKDDIWIDTTSIPYSISAYNSTSWVGIGSAGGTKINDWVSATEYKVGEYVIHDDLLYRCKVQNTDSVFIASNFTLISGHIIRDGSNFYAKRSNLKFMGNGVSITDDSANDNTIISINGDVTKTGIETLTNKSLVDSSTKIIDEIDNTKVAQFEASGIATGTSRKYSLPNKDGTMALLSDILPINDKATSGYLDIASLRVQWGKVVGAGNGNLTVTLPAPFANNTYTVTANCNDNSTTAVIGITIRSSSRTTTSFTVYRAYANPGAVGSAGEGFDWVAIGLKQ